MAHVCVVRVVEAEDQAVHRADIEVVREAVAKAVVIELAVLDQDGARVQFTGQDPVLVVAEVAMAHDQIKPFLPDARAVLVGHAALAEFDPFHRGAIALDHPDGFIAPGHAVRFEVGQTTHAAQQQIIRLPAGDIGRVGACDDLHCIAIAHQSGNLARQDVSESGAYVPNRGTGRVRTQDHGTC